MNPAQLQDILERGPRAEDLEVLRACVERHPYSGPLRMMLAKASEEAQDLGRRDALLQAGAHVPSRRALFAYLMGSELLAEARAVHEAVLKAEDVPEEEMVSMVWHDQGDAADAVDADAVVPEAEVSEEASEQEAEAEAPGQREAMISAIASVIEQDVSAWNEEAETDKTAPEDAPTETTDVPEPLPQEGVAIPTVGQVAEPRSLFSQWLQQRARETGFGTPQLAEQGAAALIDAFLAKGDVRIGPIRDSLETTEEWAKQGLVEDPSLVTETMAKLYAQQGQMGRARKAYKLLALKYPEKSVYFAAQLKKLRNS
ncbi:MAG: hypothetical protein ACPF8U_01200 [Flavobacteriales bacterium]|nr:hypothetical protein [Bacteroidota bacterium]